MRNGIGGLSRRWFLAGMIIGTAVIFSLFANSTEGAHGTVSLPGSDFEIDLDANLKVDDGAPFLDWANVGESVSDDMASGPGDDSFGKGTKEDTAVPSPVWGSIPPNKSDLRSFGVYVEENANGKFMHLFWTRVQDPKGTTNMDFEFNQAPSEDGVIPAIPPRTDGDLLIEYKLAKGGTEPQLFLYSWIDGSDPLAAGYCAAASSPPCWGFKRDFTASGDAVGSINTTVIPAADSDGQGDLDPYTFGEASVDLDSVFDSTKCTSFGSAYLKSRSSDSFTAALKDFIAPQTVNITNCGTVIIRKESNPLGATESFNFTHSIPTDPPGGNAFSLAASEHLTIEHVLAGGSYWVAEDDPSALGFELTDIDCSAGVPVTEASVANRKITFDVGVGEIVDCTFTNTALGTIVVEKQTLPDGDLEPFVFTGHVAGGIGDGGQLMVEGLRPGVYTSTELVPLGWDLTDITFDDPTNDSSGDTGTKTATFNVEAGETVKCTFTNTALGSIIVEKQTLPDGDLETFVFTGRVAGTIGDGGQLMVEGLLPGQYTSTELVPLGWDLTDITCDDGNSSGDTGTKTATFNVEAGETVKCIFTNTKRGSINVVLVTDPAVTTDSFGFSLYGPSMVSTLYFSASDGGVDLLPPDRGYALSPTVPPGWAPEPSSCDDNSPSDNIDLEPGETVTCTFSYVKEGTIVVKKLTSPEGDSTFFSFGGEISVRLSHPLTAEKAVAPGTYTVTEAVPAGWDLTDISCDDSDVINSSGDTGTATATFNVEAGETVTCTFTNTKVFTIITLVCHANQLYVSTVTLAGGAPMYSLSPSDWTSTSFNPCTLTGARFEGNLVGPHNMVVSILPLP